MRRRQDQGDCAVWERAAAAGAFITAALDRLPGHQEMLDFAASINAPLPTRARKILKERSYRP